MRMLINSKDEEANAKCLEDSFSQSVARMPKMIRGDTFKTSALRGGGGVEELPNFADEQY